MSLKKGARAWDARKESRGPWTRRGRELPRALPELPQADLPPVKPWTATLAPLRFGGWVEGHGGGSDSSDQVVPFAEQREDDLSTGVVGVSEEDRFVDEELRDRQEEFHELVQ